ncbi:MAG: sel1 repeat family protein [Deltaproteobacteria bacterium]|jgi:TPR repeat protein|nr:sel1 repeat family protein [Deltaproteobacteria bacterium]
MPIANSIQFLIEDPQTALRIVILLGILIWVMYLLLKNIKPPQETSNTNDSYSRNNNFLTNDLVLKTNSQKTIFSEKNKQLSDKIDIETNYAVKQWKSKFQPDKLHPRQAIILLLLILIFLLLPRLNAQFSLAPVNIEIAKKTCQRGNITSNSCMLVANDYRYNKKDYYQAINWYEKACDLNNGAGCFHAGLVYEKLLYDNINAHVLYGRAVSLNHAGAHNNLGTIEFIRKNYDLAELLFAKGHELGDINAYGNLGRTKMKLNKIKEAEAIFKILCHEQKWTAGACYELSVLYKEQGNIEQANIYKKLSRQKEEKKQIEETYKIIRGEA